MWVVAAWFVVGSMAAAVGLLGEARARALSLQVLNDAQFSCEYPDETAMEAMMLEGPAVYLYGPADAEHYTHMATLEPDGTLTVEERSDLPDKWWLAACWLDGIGPTMPSAMLGGRPHGQ